MFERFWLLPLLALAATLGACATNRAIPHFYPGPRQPETSLALVVGQQRNAAGIEFFAIDGQQLSGAFLGRPVAIYLMPGIRKILVEWSSQELVEKRTMLYEKAYALFYVQLNAGDRYVVEFQATEKLGRRKIAIRMRNVDTGEIIEPND